MNTPIVSRDDLWKQYEISVDLYKHYLKLVIEMNVFYYAITGAIVSYYFAHHSVESEIRFALVLPIFMSLLLAGFFIYGSIMNRYSREEMFRVRDALGLRVAPEFAVLSWILIIFAALMVVVAISLGVLLLGCFSSA